MKRTECNEEQLSFQAVGRREIVAGFDGGQMTSDGGALLLRETERRTGIVQTFAKCFRDHRDPDQIEHTLEELIGQRIFGLALGYEDLNDHDQLRNDPLLGILVNRSDPWRPLAGKSTLNRLELTVPSEADRYKKIEVDVEAVDKFFVDRFLQSASESPSTIILDMDTTPDVLHGHQEGRHFLTYYDEYCYLPLYIFSGEHLLCARLRPSSVAAAEGVVDELIRIIGQIRQTWPKVRIVLRADSDFSRDDVMTWCEQNGVEYVLGLPKNKRLEREIATEMAAVKAESEANNGEMLRRFKDLRYRTLQSWSSERRVAAKIEYSLDKENPRFVVTSIPMAEVDARTLYEVDYCGRGNMENRIKEQKCFLFSDRTSATTMRANQLRLWFSSVAYLLIDALRRLGLKGTELATAQCDTIRLRLFKIGARIRITVRKIWISMTSSYPWIGLFKQAYKNLVEASP